MLGYWDVRLLGIRLLGIWEFGNLGIWDKKSLHNADFSENSYKKI